MADALPSNVVRARMAAGEVALGLTARLSRSGEIARIARGTGHDFVRIDAQHAIYDIETIGHIAQTALACGVGCLVRVRGSDDPDIGRLLDGGVTGIVVPDVETADEARKCVDAVRFPPLGRRSAGGGYPHFDFAPIPPGEAAERLDDATLLVCMIESARGIENIDEIAAVDGVDVLHVGINDLLADLGIPGQVGDPRLDESIDKVIAAAAAHGRYSGCGGTSSIEQQRDLLARGMRFMTTKADLGFLMDAASRWVSALREEIS